MVRCIKKDHQPSSWFYDCFEGIKLLKEIVFAYVIECALSKEVAVVARGADIDPMSKPLTKQSKEGTAENEVPIKERGKVESR